MIKVLGFLFVQSICAERVNLLNFEWDRLMTWYDGKSEKKCFQLGNPQLFNNDFYENLVKYCDTLDEYECSFTSSAQFAKDYDYRKMQEQKEYDIEYPKAKEKCNNVRNIQEECIKTQPWYVSRSDAIEKCPHIDDSCRDQILSLPVPGNWPAPFVQSEFCIKKLGIYK